MGDGDAGDAGDLGGPDFAPAIPAAESSVVGTPPTNRAVIVPGPGYRGRITLSRRAHQPPPVAKEEEAAADGDPHGGGTDSPPAHHERRHPTT
ncbi:hypothetical protein ACWENR_18285 [Micromonospora sp. NPDC004336]